MKRKIITGIIIVLCFLLQTTVFDALSFSHIKPNLLIIVTASFGFMRGKKSGMFVGFICGLLSDMAFGNILGFDGIIFTLIGYGNGFFHRIFFDDDIKLPLALIGISDFLYGVVVYLTAFLLQGDFRFPYYLLHVILPELVYTIVITLVLYQIILYINKKLTKEEQRSASKFV
ncbi:rod shape-determining protein MreD [Aequitasia blattaphilus]|uniref:Rod shape-determining protein MreD n=1 Tax=Aequitasia blattaphilus TaxID=2949332 RepID=A0ABT1E7U5_9FIRM|nr:rod shape-determining protein MreD [Aequitasia blattaphilus]MCP1101694.1 rod shape-determining protein MreD [Aequitasia blattaphilus]MCR8614334.1 rod shape-determining protein MreD [Aequitasia blattaphilus]